MTEEQIKAALDGHFYRMFYGVFGAKVVDLESGTPVPRPETIKKDPVPKNKTHSINWANSDQVIFEMRRAGAGYKEIAAKTGLNKDTVRWRIRRLCQVLGIDPDSGEVLDEKFNAQLEAEVVAARNSGKTFESIGRQHGMSRAAARTLYYRWYNRERNAAA